MLPMALALYLDARGVAEYDPDGPDGAVYIGRMPQAPDIAVGLFVTGGPAASGKHGYDNPTINVQVRGAPNTTAATLVLAGEVYSALQGLSRITLEGGQRVINCRGVQSGPVDIGPDENERPRYSLNFQLEVRNITDHRE